MAQYRRSSRRTMDEIETKGTLLPAFRHSTACQSVIYHDLSEPTKMRDEFTESASVIFEE